MKGFVCSICGFIALGGVAPENCPVCGAPKKDFVEKENALATPSASADKIESNKKHIPAIIVNKKCGLIPDGCTDVNVKIGEITHPMLAEHYIMRLDFYIDRQFVSRVILTPGKINPAAAFHLKVSSGKISVVGSCNLHGSWLSETNL